MELFPFEETKQEHGWNICSKVEPYLKLSTDLTSSMSAYHKKQLSKQRDEIYLLVQMCRDFYAVL